MSVHVQEAVNESEPSGEIASHRKESKFFLPIPEAVETIANIGNVIFWNPHKKWYEVLDGPRFEEQFNALRCIRGKRKAGAIDRPFARMHVYFDLIKGERWAGAGTAFRPKAPTFNVQTDPDRTSAEYRLTSSTTECFSGQNKFQKTSGHECIMGAEGPRNLQSLQFSTPLGVILCVINMPPEITKSLAWSK